MDPVDIDLRDRVNGSIASFGSLDDTEMWTTMVGPDSPIYEALLEAELRVFPELEGLPEGNYAFWAVMQGARALHAMRLSFPTVEKGLFAPFSVHDFIRTGQVSAAEIVEELERRGHPTSQLVSVESNFRIDAAEDGSAAGPGYLGLANFIKNSRRTGVIAHPNQSSLTSFDRAGLHYEPVSLSHNLRTPSLADEGEMDDDYRPVLMPLEGANEDFLREMAPFVPTHVDSYIDLRAEGDTAPSKQGEYRSAAPL